VNALANPEVGKYLNDSFVSTYQKVGTFTVAGAQKQGGNVASYFCLADGRVLHAIAGPVDAAAFLREARWVVETYKMARLEHRDDAVRLKAFFSRAHADRLRQEHGVVLKGRRPQGKLDKPAQVHLLMVAAPLVRIEKVYKLVFEKVLGEKVSTSPVVQAGS
jgi:hypothetical protein